MIRIFTTNAPNGVTITVDGQLVGDYVDAIQTCVDQANGQRAAVQLFLRDVSHIDEHGRALLARLATEGVRLSASGVYSSYVVAEVCRDRRSGPPQSHPNGR